jgi:hypothetical protein
LFQAEIAGALIAQHDENLIPGGRRGQCTG